MKIYIGTPGNQLQASLVAGMPVLVSFALDAPWLRTYFPSFGELVLDSGAYSELTTGISVDIAEYVAWAESIPFKTAYAGLDDIQGDWKRSMRSYQQAPNSFPTFHDTDPPELLDELIPMAQERDGWLGIGLLPPRTCREAWLCETLKRIPSDIHVHGFALGAYTHLPRINSVDSTHAWREWQKYRAWAPWLTPAECLEIAVKKIERHQRIIAKPSGQKGLFDNG